ncbi:MAG: transposase, partial [Bacilli bacterium]|nr:transposase [Bacilli bacterium]
DKIRFSIPKKLKEHLNDKYQINDNFFYIKLKRHFESIKQIEFSYVDKDKYIVYVIYEKDIKKQVEDNKHYISIDIGVKNLLSVYDNNGSSFIVSGHSILNTNYYFSKKIAYYQSLFDKCYPHHKKGVTTKRIKRLYEKKNKRIKLALHRATRTIVDYCLSHDVSKVIIGDLSGLLSAKNEFVNNKEKHRYNQNVRAINFSKIYSLLDYKLKLAGIELIKVNEAYSSSCSPNSPLVDKRFANKANRVYRGLFKEGNNVFNADIVGAYNIMRIYRQNNNDNFLMPKIRLSNPSKKYIPVTDQFLNEDYVNWNGRAGNVGISGRNYPIGNELITLINQFMTKMLGNSIDE